ncbi:hypothetical protein GGI17_006175 [Coemansia sp. S146]|nr:hypothetical protein GGI17_006175 [Coemansia sp. S146]
MDAPEQTAGAPPNHSVGIEDGAIDVGIVEPLTHLQLGEIKRDVCAFKLTWEGLREQYPPGKSDFAPLSFTASSWAAIASTDVNGLDDGLETDETYSQSATMTAYGVELLRKALSGSQVDRRLTQKAYNLLATLCAMLTDSQDRHRTVTIPGTSLVQQLALKDSKSVGLTQVSTAIPIAEITHYRQKHCFRHCRVFVL